MKIKLFTYWEGYKPEYIGLCEKIISNKIESRIEHCKVSDENVENYLSKEDLSYIRNLECIAHKADYIRCCLIYKYGGIWLDSDQILISDLSEIVELLNVYDYITYEWEQNNPSIGFFASNKGNTFLGQWKDKMNTLLLSKNEFRWTELGYELMYPILDDLLKNEKMKYYAFKARESFAPLEWCEYEKFFESDINLDCKNLKSIMLYNSKFPDCFKTMTEKDILTKDYLISKLFRDNL